MTQSSNQEIYNKWAPILNDMGITGSKADCMSEYLGINKESQNKTIVESINLLPVAIKVCAKTIGQDIVGVRPLSSPGGISDDDLSRIKSEIKSDNRDSKIESLLENKEYKEKKLEDHPDYKDGTLFFLDYKYQSSSHKKTRRSRKKN